ncbi:MAG: bifunctional DNA-formamidopyrimidine glycosylase/DNA-(apurinic or apyrimidinic site) lyase, partial [Gammaproteobacteria bacterium]
PEVETVRRGLEPVMVGRRFERVELHRPDLRFPLPERFAERLTGATVMALARRGKYLLAELSTGETLIMHLGMSGRFTVEQSRAPQPDRIHHAKNADPRHEHVIFAMTGRTPSRIAYSDPRRFGFMDIVREPATSTHFAQMGPEPLGPNFTPEILSRSLQTSQMSIKAALLDQHVVAGIGNIYACEALFYAKISPKRTAKTVAGARAERLHRAIVAVLEEAIEAGGSSLKDFAAADGAPGYFQHRFKVYDRTGQDCAECAAPVVRIVQSGRSTFYCRACQK